MVELSPQSFIGADMEPYDTFSLSCLATKPPEVIPTIELLWYKDQVPVGNDSSDGIAIAETTTNEGAQRSNQITISNANQDHSGSYSCLARLTIPESTTLEESSQDAVATIRGI